METSSHFAVQNEYFSYGHTRSKNTDYEQFKQHMHPYYELLYVKNIAPSQMNVDGKLYPVRPNTLLIIKPGCYHYLMLPTKCFYERFVVTLDDDFAELVERMGDDLVFNVSGDGVISMIFDKLVKYETLLNADEARTVARNSMYEVLVYLHNAQVKRVDFDSTDSLTERTISYVADNLCSISSIDDIVNDLYVAKSTLCHTFNQNMKISLMKYVRQKKVTYAHALIKQGMKPTKACEAAGFDNYTTFFRAYKTIIGSSPKEK